MHSKTLIASISGIRGVFGNGLDPSVLVKFTAAFGMWCRARASKIGRDPVVLIGRDGRVTGPLCARIVSSTLQSAGCDVIDASLATTPTVEMAVLAEHAIGGIILSASHNPPEWNALKLLNEKGEFLSSEEGEEVIALTLEDPQYVGYDAIGSYRQKDFLDYHIERILDLDFIEPSRIAARDFKIVVDGINSVGGFAIPALLRRLGVRDENVFCLNCDVTGIFAHAAEPLPENLKETIAYVRETGADLGIVVDPDADRLALIENGGRYFSEELTQVLAADFLWRIRPGPFATNLSSSRAIDEVAARFGVPVYRSAVGEINVVKKMQEVNAVLGGEGNGGVILPELHYGRDALVGVAMVLQHLANEKAQLSEIRRSLPSYTIVKSKTPIGDLNPDALLHTLANRYRHERISTVDGLKIDFEEGWVHLRKSNTEPIMRVYAESNAPDAARLLANRFMDELKRLPTLPES